MPLNTHRILLSSPELLRRYHSSEWPPVDMDLLLSVCREALRREDIFKPDYFHEERVRTAAREAQTLSGFLCKSLVSLAREFLEFRHDSFYVKADKLQSWQMLLCHVSPLPILAAAVFCETKLPREKGERVLSGMLRYSSLPGCYDARLNDMIRSQSRVGDQGIQARRFKGRGRLYELHMHLNGSTEASSTWLYYLARPDALYDILGKSSPRVRRFYRQHNIDDPLEIVGNVELARWIWLWLAEYAFPSSGSRHGPGLSERELCAGLRLYERHRSTCSRHELFSGRHPLENDILTGIQQPALNVLQLEGELILRCLRQINHEHPVLAVLLHSYLLCQSRFIQLLVQQYEQVGFEQFQHITLADLRADQESHYEERFRQLHGMYGPDLAYLEGRFSPKAEPRQLQNLLAKIFTGYDKACGNTEAGFTPCPGCSRTACDEDRPAYIPPELTLIAHFIKQEDKKYGESGYSPFCRHHALRLENREKARTLVSVRNRNARFKECFVGVDAAGNELETPPEVYAPVFRYMRANDVTHATYHVGEDFVHLFSGLRAVTEAMQFLGVGAGDRLGHCTALGIDPDIWLRNIGEVVKIRKGEWLDNLILVLDFLSRPVHNSTDSRVLLPNAVGAAQTPEQEAAMRVLAAWVQEHAVRYFNDIYGEFYKEGYPGLLTIIEAWKMRSLDPLVALDLEPEYGAPPPWANNELLRAQEAFDNNEHAFRIFQLYHHGVVRAAYDEQIEVPTFKDYAFLYKLIQDNVLRNLIDRRIAIEVMPTSNVWISHYDEYAEHHMLSWLDDASNRPQPDFCIASDDPGIFSTTLRNELTHLLISLQNKEANNKMLPYEKLQHVINTGRAFRFKQGQQLPKPTWLMR